STDADHPALLCLETSCPQEGRPFFQLGREKGGKLLRSRHLRLETKLRECCLHLGRLEDFVHLSIEPLDHGRRGPGRRKNPLPDVRVESNIWQPAFNHRGHVRQVRAPFWPGKG